MVRTLLVTMLLSVGSAETPIAAPTAVTAPTAPTASAPKAAPAQAPVQTSPSTATTQAAEELTGPSMMRAPEPLELEKPPEPITDNSGYLLFKTLLVLGIVVSIIYLTLNVGARKLLKLGPTSNALVQVVERVPLDAKKTLYVLQAGGEFLLVGSSEGNLAFLTKLESESIKQSLAQRQVQLSGSTTFLERLTALSRSAPKKPE
jgi:flagellar biogenesis protein FliO